jgi:hypothetical protein
MITGSQWGDTLLMLLLFGGVVLVIWLLIRKPLEQPVPRDALAERGKAQERGVVGRTSDRHAAYYKAIVDECDDASGTVRAPERHHDDFSDNDSEDAARPRGPSTRPTERNEGDPSD